MIRISQQGAKMNKNGIETQQIPHFLQNIKEKLDIIAQKWKKLFQHLSSQWVIFMLTRTNNDIKQIHIIDNKESKSQKLKSVQTNAERVLNQTQKIVIQSIKNIGKLYLFPVLPQKIQKSIGAVRNINGIKHERKRSASFERNRSLSGNRNKKSSIFRNAPSTNVSKYYIKQNQSVCYNSLLSKHFKPRSTMGSQQTLGLNTIVKNQQDKQSRFTNNVSQELQQSVSSYLQKKNEKNSKIQNDELLSKFQQKLHNIQCDLNNKLNLIISTLSEVKQKKNDTEHKESIKMQITNKFLDSKVEHINKQKQKQKQKQKIKSNKHIKTTITRNPINNQNEQYECMTLNTTSPNSQANQDKEKGEVQKNIHQFLSLIKKVKLPINQFLKKNFVGLYINLCKSKHQKCPQFQKIGLQQNSKFEQISPTESKTQMKQTLMKFKKLIQIGTANGKAQMIQSYIQLCLRCCYDLILRQKHILTVNIREQLQILIRKL